MNDTVINTNDELVSDTTKNNNGYSRLYLLTLGFAQGDDGKGNYFKYNDAQSNQVGEHPIDNNSTTFIPIRVEWQEVSIVITVGIWLILVFILKFLFVKLKLLIKNKLSYLNFIRKIPESCLLILFGLILGVCLPPEITQESFVHDFLSPEFFFLVILPPIVLEAGYEMPRDAFFTNLREILTYAVVGTLLNSFLIGACLYIYQAYVGDGFAGLPGDAEWYNPLVFLLFSSIISAVDPVAVIAVFDDINVNVTLYIMVFGESLLNDGVAVVLYQVFEQLISMPYPDSLTATNILLVIATFFIIALGGLFVGIIFGYIVSFISKYSHAVPKLELVVMYFLPLLAYWVAEMCELSAILAIVFCAFTMRYYLDKNLDEHTLISLEKVIKSLAHTMEMTIFMILGLYAGQAEWKEHMDWELSLISLALCTIFRPIISCSLTAILNRYRTKKISAKDQMIMSLSGLRGGIAFFLIVLSNMNEVEGYPEGAKETFILATTFIVFFTAFIQGTLTEPIVSLFNIERTKTEDLTKVSTSFHEKVIVNLTDGVAVIIGDAGVANGKWARNFDAKVHRKMSPFLVKKDAREKQTGGAMDIVDTWNSEIQADFEMEADHQGDTDKGKNYARRTSMSREKVMEQLRGAVQLQAGDIFKSESLVDPGNRRLSKMKMGQSEIEREAKKHREALETKRAQREKIEEEIRRRALMKKRNSIFARRISSVGGSSDMSEGEDNNRKETFFKRARKSIVAFAYSNEAEKSKERNHSIASKISERRGTMFVPKVDTTTDDDEITENAVTFAIRKSVEKPYVIGTIDQPPPKKSTSVRGKVNFAARFQESDEDKSVVDF